MSEPEFDRDKPDPESMFDFLAEEGAVKHRRQKRAAESSERSLPIIRKPVPVSESGPLLPPIPGAPVEIPPVLTTGSMNVEDDLDFLNDIPDTASAGQRWRSESDVSDSDSNITRLDARSRRPRNERKRTSDPASDPVSKAPLSRRDEFDDFDLDDAPEFNRVRQGVRPVAEYEHDDESVTPRQRRWMLLALVLIAAGAGSLLIVDPVDLRALVQKFGMDSGTGTVAVDAPAEKSAGISLVEDSAVVSAASPLLQQFRDKLIQVEGLVADGALDDAERALFNMDRTVYGYGAAEFGDLETRIRQLRSGVAKTDSAAGQPDRDTAARTAEAQAAREEGARTAAEKQAALEESTRRATAEQSAREEQARVAAQQVAQTERATVAAEKARQQAARLEQDRQKEQARLSALAASTSDRPSVNADRQATDRRIAEERAAVQRQQAREQRLIEARERETALAAQASSQASPGESTVTGPRDTSDASRTAGPRTIGDDELQSVYRRFIDLQQAVSSRDINAVVGLTQRSGVRVQQLMQIFENSTQIDARIRNVSTSNATGQINGTLQINRIRRANGTFVEPPAALSSIPLSSQREGDGWSSISW